MLKDEYVIVTFPTPSGNLRALDAEEFKIDESELTPTELNDLARNSRVNGAPKMPWKLIEPTEAEEVDVAAVDNMAWGIDAIGASSSPFDGSGITVAVLDTGIDPKHQAFAGVKIERRNFTSEADHDLNGHGTHCAGTIFGQDTYGRRIGVARSVKRALIAKVLGKGSSTTALVRAINWAVSEGAHVISMSLAVDFPKHVNDLIEHDGYEREIATLIALEAYRKNVLLFSDLYQSVLSQSAFGSGLVFIAASGNESKRPQYEIPAFPPANAGGIIAVGALARGKNGYTVAQFSNSQVQISAPGVGIISARAGGGLKTISGTSMATPHVSGAAALWAQRQLEKSGRVDSITLKAQLIASGTTAPLASGEAVENIGNGIVQAPQI